jgi:hypothetical protein
MYVFDIRRGRQRCFFALFLGLAGAPASAPIDISPTISATATD